MNTKTLRFELTGEEEHAIEVEWSYTHAPAKLYGPPEDCHPDESEGEIVVPEDLKEQLEKFALETMVPRWIKEVENQISDLEFDGNPAQWAADLKESYECDR